MVNVQFKLLLDRQFAYRLSCSEDNFGDKAGSGRNAKLVCCSVENLLGLRKLFLLPHKVGHSRKDRSTRFGAHRSATHQQCEIPMRTGVVLSKSLDFHIRSLSIWSVGS
ncbi:hypothetical protein AVEN_193771-1 [Araneus ventricosus]|uniref:Uncharacterized protein n=1 Tax=Araneus ventricosus TaxID=182803 RepID=A0A4Y2DNS6_ARAVE|nr:hypothetical protein AVEN_193771-1 [Araneus ventricosus]